jgi:hypothetical protein
MAVQQLFLTLPALSERLVGKAGIQPNHRVPELHDRRTPRQRYIGGEFVRILSSFSGTAMLLFAGGILFAQQSPYVVGSTVTGHVYCADTNAPARFSKVLLKSTEADHRGDEFIKRIQDNIEKMAGKFGEAVPASKPLTEDKKQALASASKGFTQAMDMMNASTVGLHGEFRFVGVKAGTYYVHVIYAGYVDFLDQFTDADFASTDPAIRARIAQIPTITVTGADSANAEIQLERGAAISGTIVYDDGSPAAGWTISVIKPGTHNSAAEEASLVMNQALSMSGAAQVAKSDDLGHFRITGLMASEYALRATLSSPSVGITAQNISDGGSGIKLVVYSGNTFTRGDAKAITISEGEEHGGADITIPDHALHSIVGHVYAKSDNHTLNVGSIGLTSKSDPALLLTAAIRDDGSFHFEYLPSGITYTLTVSGAADGKNSSPTTAEFMGMNIASPEIFRKYGTDTTDVSLADADIKDVRLTVAATDWKPKPSNKPSVAVDPGALLNGILGATTPASDKQ